MKNERHNASCKLIEHRDRVVTTLSSSGYADIADQIATCSVNTSKSPTGRDLPVRCHHLFCPHCRKIRMNERVKSYRDRFLSVPTENLAMVTLLFQPHHDLWTPFAPKILRTSDRRKLTNGSPAAKVEIDRIKLRYSRLLDRSFDEYIQAGSVEFEEVFPSSGPNKRAFVESFEDATEIVDSVLVSHAHFVFAARNDGKWLTHEDIRAALRSEFTHPFQVRIDPPKKVDRGGRLMTRAQAVTGFLRYSMKGFSSFTNIRLCQLAEFDRLVSKHFYAFNRATEKFRRSVPVYQNTESASVSSKIDESLNRTRLLLRTALEAPSSTLAIQP